MRKDYLDSRDDNTGVHMLELGDDSFAYMFHFLEIRKMASPLLHAHDGGRIYMPDIDTDLSFGILLHV